jgi:fusion protein PurCD
MTTATTFSTPQLGHLHSGKVRESFRVDDSTRLIVVTDRLSAFDKVLATPIPMKGAVLNTLSAWWFERSRDVIGNHMVAVPDPCLMLVREATPIRVEMVVRGYLAGSMWRAYQKGERTFWGVTLPDGMSLHDRFEEPLPTPTTKEASDKPISAGSIVSEGWATAEQYDRMRRASLDLFQLGTEILGEKGMTLVDTKYEFGVVDGEVILIDELHTSDSSRIWDTEAYRLDPANVEALDKEYVRRWLISEAKDGGIPDTLPEEVVAETTRRYLELCMRVTGSYPQVGPGDPRARMAGALATEGIIRDGYVAIIMGSKVDLEHARAIATVIERYNVAVDLRVVSAHKNGEEIPALVAGYNSSAEPGAVIATAGGSNGLGGALAANLNLPVINCPPFKDQVDLLMNVGSSLMMPSLVPAMTVVKPVEAALAALRALNLPRLRDRFSSEISSMKASLNEDDRAVRGR